MKKVLVTVLLLLGVFMLTSCGKEVDQADAYVTVDVNPSFEMMTNGEGEVSEVIAINGDAEVVLHNLSLVGLKLDVAIEAVIKKSYQLGFIKGENHVVVGVEKEENKQALINHLQTKLLKMKQMKLKVHSEYKEGLSAELDLLASKAKEHGMTLTRYRMVSKARLMDAEMSYQRGKDLSVKELNEHLRGIGRYIHPVRLELRSRLESYNDYLGRNLLRKARIVDALGKLILTTTPSYFDPILEEGVKAEELVMLYEEYLRALEKVNILPFEPNYDELKTTLKADSEIALWIGEVEELRLENKALIVQIKEDNEEAILKFEANLTAIEELIGKINAKLVILVENEALVVTYHFDIIIKPVKPEVSMYQKIRDTYAEMFIKYGVSIDKYEQFVLDILLSDRPFVALKAQFDAFIKDCEAELENLKNFEFHFELSYKEEVEQREIYLKAKVRIGMNKGK